MEKAHTTNILERLNEEVCCRERVIRIFPSRKHSIHLIGVLLIKDNRN
ncbi:transposase [Caldanaerobacter subterraneus]